MAYFYYPFFYEIKLVSCYNTCETVLHKGEMIYNETQISII